MSETQKRKWERKQKRISHILFRDTGVNTCEISKFLMVCNAGLVSGLQREEVVDLFAPFGTIENVVMVPGKSYCFVAFRDELQSEKAYVALNGKASFKCSDTTLYLVYCDRDEQGRFSSVWPVGLKLIHDFVSEEEEVTLLKCVQWESRDENQGKSLKHRRVKHYGYEFRYDNNNVDKDEPLSEDLPEQCSFLTERLMEKAGSYFKPNQLTINEYQPGQGIPSHVDTHSAFGDIIASLSLGSSVVMEFRCDGEHVCLSLPRRSILVMTGESRYRWAHGITPRKMDVVKVKEERSGEVKEYLSVQHRGTRTSFTFRQIRQGQCFCNFHPQCDSYKLREAAATRNTPDNSLCKSMNPSLNNQLASKLETMHVRDVYEEIASHFSLTRHKAWPNVSKFVEELPIGSILFDVGCGNGKYFGCNKGIFEVGCDQSNSLCKVATNRGHQVFTCNCLHVPLRPGTADACICIAVIHHLSTKERRFQALVNIVEVLRPGGQALVYVWAREQERGKIKSSYLHQVGKKSINVADSSSEVPLDHQSSSEVPLDHQIPELNLSLPVHVNRTDFKHGDLLVPWKLNMKGDSKEELKKESPTFFRYYHVFEQGELDSLCGQITGVKLKKSYYDQGNWCVLIEKE